MFIQLSLSFTGQNFAHHQPRNGPEADGESDDKEHEADQWQPSVLRHVVSVFLVVEKRAERDERDGHGRAGGVQQYFPAEFIDESRCYERRYEVHDADYDGAQVFVNSATRLL